MFITVSGIGAARQKRLNGSVNQRIEQSAIEYSETEYNFLEVEKMYTIEIKTKVNVYDNRGELVEKLPEHVGQSICNNEDELYAYLKSAQNQSGEFCESRIYDNVVLVRYYEVSGREFETRSSRNHEVVYTVLKDGSPVELDYDRVKYLPVV